MPLVLAGAMPADKRSVHVGISGLVLLYAIAYPQCILYGTLGYLIALFILTPKAQWGRGILKGATTISVSFLLGFAFILIIQGLVFGFVWLAPYWSVTYQLLRKKLNLPSVNPQATNIPITWWRIPIIAVQGLLSLAMIYYGLKILFAQGFLHQNLLWLLFSSN